MGRPPGRMDPADYVLRRFTAGEEPDVELLVGAAAEVLVRFAAEGADAARQHAGETAKRLGISD